MILTRLKRLRRRFSNKTNVIQTRSGVSTLQQPALHRHWIVGRELCMYRSEDFAHVPRVKRGPALELKLPVWSPFRNTGFHCVWMGSLAMVWFWDADGVQGKPATGPGWKPAEGARVLPETVFHPRKPDGVHLQACREGFELQHWRADALLDSFWCAERPDEGRIDWFLARCGIEASAADLDVPFTQTSAFDPEPWAGRVPPREWLEANEPALAAVSVCTLVMIGLWQEVRFWKTFHFTQTVAATFTRIQDEVAPLLQARNELVRLRSRNGTLSALLATPSQAYLMGEVDRALPSASATLHEWRYQRGELSIVVEDAKLDQIAYIRALEAHPLFTEVRAAQAGKADRLKISMRVGV